MEQPTAEDTLDKFLEGFDWPHWSKDNAIMAMEEHASAAVSKYKEELKQSIIRWEISHIPVNIVLSKMEEIKLSNPSTTKL